MSITITIIGETLAECYAKLGAKAAGFSSSEELLEELRSRMRPQGLVVNVDPAQEPAADEPDTDTDTDTDTADAAGFETAEAAPSSPPADKPKRGRPRKEVAAVAGTSTAPSKAVEQLAKEHHAAQSSVTRDQVIAALNTYSTARGGQVAGRQVMQDVCGVTKLIDVKPEDYAKLLAALTAV